MTTFIITTTSGADMKKILFLIFAALMLCVAAGCDHLPASVPDNPPPSESDDVPPAEPDGEQAEPPTPADPAVYIFVEGAFVGSWQDGAFKSLNHAGGVFGDEYISAFMLQEILTPGMYYAYDETGLIFTTDKIGLYVSDGVGSFAGPEIRAALMNEGQANYDVGSAGTNRVLQLPHTLGDTAKNAIIPGYSFFINFTGWEQGVEPPQLAVSRPLDLSARRLDHEVVPDPEDYDEIRKIFAMYEVKEEPYFWTCVDGDFDGDGEIERLLVAGNPDQPYIHNDPADQTGSFYSIALLRESDGNYVNLFKYLTRDKNDVTDWNHLQFCGAYDINGNGKYELLFSLRAWESGFNFVLSFIDDGEWATVLRCNWGM